MIANIFINYIFISHLRNVYLRSKIHTKQYNRRNSYSLKELCVIYKVYKVYTPLMVGFEGVIVARIRIA